MNSSISPQILDYGKSFILCDKAYTDSLSPVAFKTSYWLSSQCTTLHTAGRAQIAIFKIKDTTAVLRRYKRGGMIAKVNKQRYLFSSLEKTRPFLEWRMLSDMYKKGLPVPRPIAAFVERKGLSYTGALITRQIPNSKTLVQRLEKEPLPETMWNKIGTLIGRFHLVGAFHADLNGHNILLGDNDEVFLIDWDKGEFRPDNYPCGDNLSRLHRSLTKESHRGLIQKYTPHELKWLMNGYNAISST